MRKATVQAVRSSVRLDAEGKPGKAIDLLESTLDQVVAAKAIEDILFLSLHASIICEGRLQDEPRARRILRRALQYAPTDTSALISLARLYLKVGRKGIAKVLLDRRRETIAEKENIGLQQVIDAMSKQLAD